MKKIVTVKTLIKKHIKQMNSFRNPTIDIYYWKIINFKKNQSNPSLNEYENNYSNIIVWAMI